MAQQQQQQQQQRQRAQSPITAAAQVLERLKKDLEASGLYDPDSIISKIRDFGMIISEFPSVLDWSLENIITCAKKAIATGVDMNPSFGYHSFMPRLGRLAHDLSAKGWVQLYRNAGCTNINILALFNDDEYEVDFKNGKWSISIRRCELRGRTPENLQGFVAYMEYEGEIIIDEISVDEVRKIRDRYSSVYNSKKKPGVSELETGSSWDFLIEMGRKTVARHVAKYAPLTKQVAAATADPYDEQTDNDNEPQKFSPEPEATSHTQDEMEAITEMCNSVINDEDNAMPVETRERARAFMAGRNIDNETGEITEGNTRTYRQLNNFFNNILSEFITNELPS